jgi:hypothetical protein
LARRRARDTAAEGGAEAATRLHRDRYQAAVAIYLAEVGPRPDLREQAVPEGAELITARAGSPAADIAESLTVNEQRFEPSAAAATAAQAEAFRSSLAGCAAVTVRLAGAGTSGGMYTPVRDGVTELVGRARRAQPLARPARRAARTRPVNPSQAAGPLG